MCICYTYMYTHACVFNSLLLSHFALQHPTVLTQAGTSYLCTWMSSKIQGWFQPDATQQALNSRVLKLSRSLWRVSGGPEPEPTNNRTLGLLGIGCLLQRPVLALAQRAARMVGNGLAHRDDRWWRRGSTGTCTSLKATVGRLGLPWRMCCCPIPPESK